MQLILFDDQSRFGLMPFTRTRPAADIRCGIFTMRERWEKLLGQKSSSITEAYLQQVFPPDAADDNLLVNGGIFASSTLANAIKALQPESKLVKDDTIIAARTTRKELSFDGLAATLQTFSTVSFEEKINQLKNTWDIFSQNDRAIREDFAIITEGRQSDVIPEGVTVTGKENLFIEPGAIVNAGTIINAATGPVYLAKDAEILEGCMLRGPIALGEHAVLKMGAKIYGGTTIGEGCKVGGEISNVVFFANSNKGHDGYLGNAVIGEWCNLGADTNCSNLKNNYDEVKIWDEYNNKSIKTGLTFCGLLMGDHSKCGINTMFNTGTVAGVSCNIYGGNFPEKFIPSFCWGGSEGMVTYDFNRAMDTANRMMGRRNKSLSPAEIEMYRWIFEQTTEQRNIFAK
ncbi:GlmU family protein [Taibaiella soli]|uniref:Glucose-1-phosphate thymidylyltransferase n=1 Tax=Taibaiella soli TaxID=1649169 RepID=A0A2W2B115_9BACT|nr:GlmU family protein [Taibaiella soli]PZF73688.1 glucose-1-phosphate thymidylyltransferase [Taibaiella soli]